MTQKIKRRQLLSALGLGASAGAMVDINAAFGAAQPTVDSAAPKPGADAPAAAVEVRHAYLFLNPAEAAFVEAVVDTFVPADELTPSGVDCGLAEFIDRQLAGAWGAGKGFYRSGPYFEGKPEHGYQLSLTPSEYWREGIAAMNGWARGAHGRDFDRLDTDIRQQALSSINSGSLTLSGFDVRQFLNEMLRLTMEGLFADPIYGGNRDKIGWRMVGYPGLPATYATAAEEYRGRHMPHEPQSIQDFS